MRLGILRNETKSSSIKWENACNNHNIDYDVIDLIQENWLDQVMQNNHSGFLACPPGIEYLYKDLYDERIYIINKVLDKLVYPHFEEISIHENKKCLEA